MKRRHLASAVAVGVPLVLAGCAAAGGSHGSLAMRAAALVVRTRGKPLANAETFRTDILKRSYPAAAAIPARLAKAVDIREDRIDGRRVVTLTPKTGASRWHIVYTHGGAYVNALSGPHWDIVRALIDATGATVTVPLYPLAPEFNNRDAFTFLTAVYRQVLATTAASDIVLAGDSAGGGLALGQAVEFRRLGLPAPARIIAFSPWLDLTLADPAARAIEPRDLMLGIDALRLCGTWWAAGDDPHLPRLSPLYADPAALPPTDIYQGTEDLLMVDARTFAGKAAKAGTAIGHHEYKGAFHVFVGATFTPEAKDAFARIAATLPR